MSSKITVFWFRRDLRLEDNAGLYHALKEGDNVLPLFIFDKVILDKLEDPADRRVGFIYQTIVGLDKQLQTMRTGLLVKYGDPIEIWKSLMEEYAIVKVYTNHDYEPYAIQRDARVHALLKERGIPFHSYKDQCVFEKNEVTKEDGTPYTVFTPYSRKWKAKLNDFYVSSYPCKKYWPNFLKWEGERLISLDSMGFKQVVFSFPADKIEEEVLHQYHQKRDYPGVQGTSRLGVHLRFGTLSIRQLARRAMKSNATFLGELIWRDFYMMILYHFGYVERNSFRPSYDKIQWRNNEEEFAAWCEGRTGYPLVDAGMRELNNTGFMHNRVRMVVASFLTKHLLIDWRWGEAYFGQKLLDYDLAANNGGWQWAAGSGTDAAPYFRVFNPYLQAKRFDPQMAYIKKWVPEVLEKSYPAPIVDHEFARQRCLETYKRALT